MPEKALQNIDILPFHEDLLDPAANLYVSVFRNEPWNESWNFSSARSRLFEIYRTPGFMGFVFQERASKDALALAMGVMESMHDGKHFYFRELCVRPDQQKQGLGKAAAAHMENAVIAAGAKEIYLFTASNSSVEEFYRRRGYKTVEKMIVMNRELKPTS